MFYIEYNTTSNNCSLSKQAPLIYEPEIQFKALEVSNLGCFWGATTLNTIYHGELSLNMKLDELPHQIEHIKFMNIDEENLYLTTSSNHYYHKSNLFSLKNQKCTIGSVNFTK